MANEATPQAATPEATKQETLGVQNAPPGTSEAVIGLQDAKAKPAVDKPVEAKKQPAKKAKAEEVEDVDASGCLLPGDSVVYWDLPAKDAKVRKVFGHVTNLTPRHARVAEVHPAGPTIHLMMLVPGAWISLVTDEVETPQIGKFTRLPG